MFFSPKFLAFENILTEEFWLFPHLTLVTGDKNMAIKLEIKREHEVGYVYVWVYGCGCGCVSVYLCVSVCMSVFACACVFALGFCLPKPVFFFKRGEKLTPPSKVAKFSTMWHFYFIW